MTTSLALGDDPPAPISAVAYASEMARDSSGKHLLPDAQQTLARRFTHGTQSNEARDHPKERGELAASASRSVLDQTTCPHEFMIAVHRPAEVIARGTRLRAHRVGHETHRVRRALAVWVGGQRCLAKGSSNGNARADLRYLDERAASPTKLVGARSLFSLTASGVSVLVCCIGAKGDYVARPHRFSWE